MNLCCCSFGRTDCGIKPTISHIIRGDYRKKNNEKLNTMFIVGGQCVEILDSEKQCYLIGILLLKYSKYFKYVQFDNIRCFRYHCNGFDELFEDNLKRLIKLLNNIDTSITMAFEVFEQANLDKITNMMFVNTNIETDRDKHDHTEKKMLINLFMNTFRNCDINFVSSWFGIAIHKHCVRIKNNIGCCCPKLNKQEIIKQCLYEREIDVDCNCGGNEVRKCCCDQKNKCVNNSEIIMV